MYRNQINAQSGSWFQFCFHFIITVTWNLSRFRSNRCYKFIHNDHFNPCNLYHFITHIWLDSDIKSKMDEQNIASLWMLQKNSFILTFETEYRLLYQQHLISIGSFRYDVFVCVWFFSFLFIKFRVSMCQYRAINAHCFLLHFLFTFDDKKPIYGHWFI